MQDYVRWLRQLVADATPRLLALGEDASTHARAPETVPHSSPAAQSASVRQLQLVPVRFGDPQPRANGNANASSDSRAAPLPNPLPAERGEGIRDQRMAWPQRWRIQAVALSRRE